MQGFFCPLSGRDQPQPSSVPASSNRCKSRQRIGANRFLRVCSLGLQVWKLQHRTRQGFYSINPTSLAAKTDRTLRVARPVAGPKFEWKQRPGVVSRQTGGPPGIDQIGACAACLCRHVARCLTVFLPDDYGAVCTHLFTICHNTLTSHVLVAGGRYRPPPNIQCEGTAV